MGTGRVLMVIAETLAVVAVVVQFVLPSEMLITLSIGHRLLGLSIRWVVPLLALSIAGLLSVAALFTIYWQLGTSASQ